jgi:cation diffusion facilitator family transporter
MVPAARDQPWLIPALWLYRQAGLAVLIRICLPINNNAKGTFLASAAMTGATSIAIQRGSNRVGNSNCRTEPLSEGKVFMAGGSNRVILTALAANVGIAIAKFIAAGITGSSAMLTEGVHSLVDSTNHVLLLYGTKRAKKAADQIHPLGYGRELYFWSFVVAILVFSLGSGVAIYEGILHIFDPEPASDPTIAFIVLAVAFALESWSTWAALKEFNVARGKRSMLAAIRSSKDAPTIIILLENGGALAGLVLAACGIAASIWTHNPVWDGVASVLIGLVLAAVAILLLIEAKGLLIGESADPALVEALRHSAAIHDGVDRVHEVLTVHHAPDQIVAVISADFDDNIHARDVERIVRDIEAKIAADFPVVTRLYVRPVSSM